MRLSIEFEEVNVCVELSFGSFVLIGTVIGQLVFLSSLAPFVPVGSWA